MKVASGKDAANLDEMESEINNLYNEVVRVDNLKPLSNNSRIEFMQSLRKWILGIGSLKLGTAMAHGFDQRPSLRNDTFQPELQLLLHPPNTLQINQAVLGRGRNGELTTLECQAQSVE